MAKSKMVDLWLTKASRDLRFSKAALTLEEHFYDEIVFHCQQSAEKSIKGFLAHHRQEFTKTHDIGQLLTLVSKIDPQLSQLLSAAKILTKYAVAIRYPESQNEETVIDKELVNNCIALAESVYVEVFAKIS